MSHQSVPPLMNSRASETPPLAPGTFSRESLRLGESFSPANFNGNGPRFFRIPTSLRLMCVLPLLHMQSITRACAVCSIGLAETQALAGLDKS